jgi:hypothetical protein
MSNHERYNKETTGKAPEGVPEAEGNMHKGNRGAVFGPPSRLERVVDVCHGRRDKETEDEGHNVLVIGEGGNKDS